MAGGIQPGVAAIRISFGHALADSGRPDLETEARRERDFAVEGPSLNCAAAMRTLR